ncbi:glycoside hydrolase superfamily [Bombardia bombarda]|uniref:Glycoside hydrolase superfamily n=1 Tax=Bombardia bombarda TaxID=252184 RepID=A0AA39XHS8_9PEZI|nr:glycoside hydrolase superfamily [Bombardia bombarda]
MAPLIWDASHRFVSKQPWWKSAVFYQVYPASFKDSNSDGWGDLPGLVSCIPYLESLGVDVVWVSPIFESPQADMGYDVSDYQRIYAPYGTVADVDNLVASCHARGMKVILDLVINHTSVEHAWFAESRSSTTNAKRDWYIWKPARYSPDGTRHPPTNWRSYFAGSTWTWDELTQQYYLHLYAPDQPDLNWDNADCRDALYADTMRFWLDRGVDGFRIDTVNKYSKDPSFRDAPITDPSSAHQPAPEMWCNGPRIHEFIHEMNRKALAPYDAVSVGELSNTPHPAQVLPYISAANQELDMVFEFSVIRLGNGDIFGGKYTYQPWKLSTLKALTAKWQSFIEGTDGWTTAFIENHDNGRAVSRFGDCGSREWWARSAKTIALWQASMTGSLFLYQGQEIGMTNMPATWDMAEYKDIEARNFYAEALATGDEERVRSTMHGLSILARDHARLPFQWSAGQHAGFMAAGDGNEGESARPWMRVHDDYREVNVQKQAGDPDSVLEFYKKVLKMRKLYPEVFVFGSHTLLDAENEHVWAFVKEAPAGDEKSDGMTDFGTGQHKSSNQDSADATFTDVPVAPMPALIVHSKRTERLAKRQATKKIKTKHRAVVDWQPRGILDLPYEILMSILTLLRPRELFILLRVCRQLRLFIRQEEDYLASQVIRLRYACLAKCFCRPHLLENLDSLARATLLVPNRRAIYATNRKRPFQHIPAPDIDVTCSCLSCNFRWSCLCVAVDFAHWQDHLDKGEPIPVIARGSTPQWNADLVALHAEVVLKSMSSMLWYTRILEAHLDSTMRSILRHSQNPSNRRPRFLMTLDDDVRPGIGAFLEKKGPATVDIPFIRDNYYMLEAFMPNRSWIDERGEWAYVPENQHDKDLDIVFDIARQLGSFPKDQDGD